MNPRRKYWQIAILAAVMLSGCVAAGYDNGDVGVGVGYVGGFYEPGGYGYGGWGRGYHVGPPILRDHPRGRGRPAPSIPHAPRGGGGSHRR
jgi:hypothetical protein